jgi:hypothetical protein
MDRDRYEEWVKCSFRFIRDPERDLDLPHHIQLLGIIDADIHGIRKSELFTEDGSAIEDEDGVLLMERAQILAHLWVLGTYEHIRMLTQRIQENPQLVANSSALVVEETKRIFERIRIPLAKREASRRHSSSDYQVALPGVGSRGIAWKIADNVIVSQEELSDAFLRMLASLKPHQHSENES